MSNPELREKAVERDNYHVITGEKLPYEVEYVLAQVIHKEIILNVNVERHMLKLLNCYDYNVQGAFKLIDTTHTRNLTVKKFKDFFKKEKMVITQPDIEAFIRRLDRNFEFKVSFKDFADVFSSGSLSSEKKGKNVKPSYLTPTKAFQSGFKRKKSMGTEGKSSSNRGSSILSTKSRTFKSHKSKVKTVKHSKDSEKSQSINTASSNKKNRTQ